MPHRRANPTISTRAVALLASILGMLPAAALPAPAAADLRWDWDPGSRFAYTLTETMSQTITGPAETGLDWTREIGFTDEALTHGPEGVTVRRSFEHVAVTVARDGAPPRTHDTRNPDPATRADPFIAPFISLAGHAITFTVSPEGKVTDLSGSDRALDAMLGPLAKGPLVAGLGRFSSDPARAAHLARQLEQSLRLIPGRAVSKGESWSVEIDHETPIAGPLRSTITATLAEIGSDGRFATISLAGDLAQPEGEGGGAAALLGIALESGTITGSALFDAATHSFQTSDMTLRTVWSIGPGLADGQPMRQTIEQRARLEQRPAADPAAKP